MTFKRILILFAAAAAALAADRGSLRAGAAKVDITPSEPSGLKNLWETSFTGVHDNIYARALVFDNGIQTLAIVAVDTVEFKDATDLTQRVSRETGIPTSNIILAASHNHNSPMVSLTNAGATRRAGPGAAVWIAKVEDDIISAIRQAKSSLQPARVGVGTGTAYVNVNRSEHTSKGWIRGVNPEGPSDKTVWVVKVESTAGEPIAFFINYAVHGVVLEPENTLITGDLPGMTARFVENAYRDKVVALWTVGSAGDQNPAYMSWDTVTEKTGRSGFPLAQALSHMLGEEVVRVARSINRMSSEVRLAGIEKVASCPGRKRDPEARKRGEVKFDDAGPVSFRLALLMVDNIALTAISGEVVTRIYWRLRRESPYTNTILVALANGRIGYIVDDAAYGTPDLDVLGSPLKRGCAEDTIVNGFVDMMRQF